MLATVRVLSTVSNQLNHKINHTGICYSLHENLTVLLQQLNSCLRTVSCKEKGSWFTSIFYCLRIVDERLLE